MENKKKKNHRNRSFSQNGAVQFCKRIMLISEHFKQNTTTNSDLNNKSSIKSIIVDT